jgi:hypothetical protein
MRTVTHPPTLDKHYATYLTEGGAAVYGFATMLRGRGWLFDTEDGQWMVLCPRNDWRLDVGGLVALADAQLADDIAKREAEAQAGRCKVCGMIGCRGDQACAGPVIETLAAVMTA